MKTNISNRLKLIMSERNLKQVDILNKTLPLQIKYNVRLAKNDLSQYVNGKVEPNQERIFILAKALDVSEAWLMGFDVPRERIDKEDNVNELINVYQKLNESRKNKVYNFAEKQLDEQNNIIDVDFVKEDNKTIITNRRTAAGSALHVDDTDARKEVVSSALIPKGADELVEVVGKSMEPLIKDGQKIYMRYQPGVENGEIAIVRIENEGVTCKRFYANNGTITLRSENEGYEDMHFDASQVAVLGKVLL